MLSRFACLAPLLLAACGGSSDAPVQTAAAEAPAASVDWRAIATDSDRARLREWRTAWMRGIDLARSGGHADAIASEGQLLNPDVRLDWRDPPPGEYACRVIKVGGRSESMLDYVAYPSFTCRVRQEGGMMSLAKLSGSQRPIGMLLPMAEDRMVFLGTLQLGDESRALQYGQDRERDMAGVIDRVGEQRWRLFFPYPHFESTIDIVELVPKAAG